MNRRSGAAALLVLACFAKPAAQPPDLAALAPLLDAAIARKELPGAVVLVGRGDELIFKHAFGHRAVEPAAEPMTEDTIFDVASLTKVVATTTTSMTKAAKRVAMPA